MPPLSSGVFGSLFGKTVRNGNFAASIRLANVWSILLVRRASSLSNWTAASIANIQTPTHCAAGNWLTVAIASFGSGTATCLKTSRAAWKRFGWRSRIPHLTPTPTPIGWTHLYRRHLSIYALAALQGGEGRGEVGVAAATSLRPEALLSRRYGADNANVAAPIRHRLKDSPPHPNPLRPTGGEGEEATTLARR